MTWVIDGNAAGFAEFGRRVSGSRRRSNRVTDDSCRELDRRAELLEQRRESGFVRQCHGDLHLRNIVLLGRATDAVRRRRVQRRDFLHGRPVRSRVSPDGSLAAQAAAPCQRRLEPLPGRDRQTSTACSLLPLFLSCRAAVRAKTSATAAQLQNDVPRRNELHGLAREYLAMAEQLLHPPVHPSSRSEVSRAQESRRWRSVSRHLVGAVPGAVVLRSDETRKRLCGVPLLKPLGPEGYSSQVSERVYATLAERAALIVRGRSQRHRRCGVCAGGRPAGHRTGGGCRIGAVHRAVA